MKRRIISQLFVAAIFLIFLNNTAAQDALIIPQASTVTAQVTVPKVTGMDQADAENALQKAGLVVSRVIERQTRLPDGRVFRQRPGPDTQVAKGSGVVLLVSRKGAPAMQPRETIPETPLPSDRTAAALKTEAGIPAVTGKPFSEAFQELRKLGFSKIQPQKVKSTEPRETVIGVLANGEEVTDAAYPLDTPIALLVSTGAEAAAPVQATGQPQPSKAKKTLQPGPVTIVDPFFTLNIAQLGTFFKAKGHGVQYQMLADSRQKGTVVGIVMDGRNLKAGDQVPEAKGVTLQASGGPDYKPPAGSNGLVQTKMPEVKNAKITDLAPKLKANGQDVSIREVPSNEDPGTVTGAKTGNQNLKGGENIPVGGQVDIQVSGGPGFQMQSQATASGKPPLIVEFKADPATLIYGGQINLTWNTTDAQRIKIEKREKDGSGKISKQTVYDQPIPKSTDIGVAGINGQPGTASCNISKTTVFTLIATNAAGSVNQCATVKFLEPPQIPQILFFSAGTGHPDVPVQPDLKQNTKQQMQAFPKGPFPPNPSMPPPDEKEFTETLSWQIINLGEDGKAYIRPDIGEVAETGSVTVPVTGEKVYILTAQNSAGIDTATVCVRPPKPTIQYFGVHPNPLARVGDAVSVGWRVVQADQIYLSPDGAPIEPEGTLEKSLIEPTTYKLTAQNVGGITRQEIKVEIADYQKGIYLFEATPDSVSVGGRTTLHFILLGLGPNPRILIQSTPPLPAVTTWNTGLQLRPANNMDESRSFTLQSNTTFKLSVLTADGTTYEKSLTVEAGMTPYIGFFGLDKIQQPSTGNSIIADLRWTVLQATLVHIEPDLGDVPLQGTQRITLNTPVLYCLTAYGNPTSIVARDTLWTGDPAYLTAHPQIYDFHASPSIASETNDRVGISWSGQGVAAGLKKYRNRDLVDHWDNLKIEDQVFDNLGYNATYSLSMASFSDTLTKLLDLEYQLMPTLEVLCKHPSIITGQTDTLIWQAGNLGSTGKVTNQNNEELDATGYEFVTPSQTTTYRFKAKNEAGEVTKQVTVEVIPPTPYMTLLDLTPQPIIRETGCMAQVRIAYCDSVQFWEKRPDNSREYLCGIPTNPQGVSEPGMSFIPLQDYPIRQMEKAALEFVLCQDNLRQTLTCELTVLPNVDLRISASFGCNNPAGLSGYDITSRIGVTNDGKDTWYATPAANGGNTVQIKIAFPSLLSGVYDPLCLIVSTGDATSIKMDIPPATVLAPGRTVNLAPPLLNLPILYDGTYTVTSIVDHSNLAVECVETNNEISHLFTASTEEDIECFDVLGAMGGGSDTISKTCFDGYNLIFYNTGTFEE